GRLYFDRWIVVEVGAEPAFDFGEGHVFAALVIEDLVAAEFADAEVLGFGMGEVEAADAGARPHRVTFSELDAGVLFDFQQLPKRLVLRVMGTGRVGGGGTDAAVFFVDEIFFAEVLGFAEAPLFAGFLVKIFGEGFGEAIGEGFGHDGVVIVVI